METCSMLSTSGLTHQHFPQQGQVCCAAQVRTRFLSAAVCKGVRVCSLICQEGKGKGGREATLTTARQMRTRVDYPIIITSGLVRPHLHLQLCWLSYAVWVRQRACSPLLRVAECGGKNSSLALRTSVPALPSASNVDGEVASLPHPCRLHTLNIGRFLMELDTNYFVLLFNENYHSYFPQKYLKLDMRIYKQKYAQKCSVWEKIILNVL